jgi:hypothetical protein
LVVRLVVVPLGLVISLIFRFLGHGGAYESNQFFGAKEKDDDDNNTNINRQQDNKSEKAKGGWVLCNFLGFCFVVQLLFFLYISVKPKKKLNM